MGRILFDVLEINIAATFVILLLCLLAEKLRKRYGARWLKLAWILLAVRLVIPYNFSLPSTEVRLFNVPGFAQEEQVKVEDAVDVGSIIEAVDDAPVQMEEAANMQMEGMTNNPTAEIAENTTTDELTNITSGTLESPIENASESETQDSFSVGGQGNSEESITDNTDTKNAEDVGAEVNKEITVDHMTYTNILLGAWLLGVVGFALYYIVVYVVFQRRCGEHMHRLANGELLEQIQAFQKECLGKVRLEVYQSDRVASPILLGLWVPKLVLPTNNGEWQVQQLRMVMIHELCHYRQKDLWLKLLMLTAHCLNWFNPALVLMKREFFYDIELVCDRKVLAGCEAEEKALYARTMLLFAKKEKQWATFSTGFADSKKELKKRIGHMFEEDHKRRGLGAFVLVMVLFLGMGLLISCGYKPQEQESGQQVNEEEISKEAGGKDTNNQNINETEESEQDAVGNEQPFLPDFTYNNGYNSLLCIYEGNTYLSKSDGIYLVQESGDTCIFANEYDYSRGMALLEDKLYFCGSITRRNEVMNTIYCMDLNTYKVKDALGAVSNSFYILYDAAIYDNKLYASCDSATRIGFQLDGEGYVIERLDATAEEYLYKECNAYYSLQLEQWNERIGTTQWQEIWDKKTQMYCPVMDVAACMTLLDGKYVVSKYQDESSVSLWLTDGIGNYDYLCDAFYYSVPLITKKGMYYKDYNKDGFTYIDFETRETREVFAKGAAEQIYLLNYDATYIYFGYYASTEDGKEQEYLMRQPHEGGEAQVIYVFEDGFRLDLLPTHNSIDAEYMYFDEEYFKWASEERVSLIPQSIETLADMKGNKTQVTTGTGVLGMQKITQEEATVTPTIVEYTLDEALEVGEVLKFAGDLPGTGLGTLYIITIDGVEHFYGQYDFYGYDMKDYYGYAIFSENYELACGIKVGMSQEEVLEKYPYMRIEDFEGNCLSASEYPNAVWWNGTAYPGSTLGTDPDFEYNGKDYNWLDQFDYVMIADIDLGTNDTLPVCLGLLMKDEKVKAITFYYPTAG